MDVSDDGLDLQERTGRCGPLTKKRFRGRVARTCEMLFLNYRQVHTAGEEVGHVAERKRRSEFLLPRPNVQTEQRRLIRLAQPDVERLLQLHNKLKRFKRVRKIEAE